MGIKTSPQPDPLDKWATYRPQQQQAKPPISLMGRWATKSGHGQ